MWTAVSLALAYGAIFGLYACWAASNVADGSSAWPFVLGLPLVYLAVPLLFVSIWFAIAWLFRAERPDGTRLRAAWRIAAVLARVRDDRRQRAADDPLPRPRARPAARAVATRRSC